MPPDPEEGLRGTPPGQLRPHMRDAGSGSRISNSWYRICMWASEEHPSLLRHNHASWLMFPCFRGEEGPRVGPGLDHPSATLLTQSKAQPQTKQATASGHGQLPGMWRTQGMSLVLQEPATGLGLCHRCPESPNSF